ncbi:Stk1 family PASTA domain-containing Ser/Thr kinase [Saccharothrix coeruleofusca]|uniref:non-specific serine/threonine protein kinase n=1 Tax=Saccharothrix coeruleofusca TaxID=33919 RepID=A0A918AKE9_9PSEU|nr:Stk1 family PASTA domain-containing Ser/Thr kinase [Saccharothrix coeruleofusca]MBP2339982.1 serine/threonine-protein kinase [Saccharothrix coeruleofusca]GGP38167.1 serine/threonine protein kinase [Saccharothrix coeruleofusca]
MSTPRLLSNRYELGETLGYGGMSEVHKGRDVRLGRDVAIKVLRADLARDAQFQERFRREAQNSAALNHPAIVAVYDTGETETQYGPLPYIVMEYVDGRTLRDIVKTQGPLSGKRAMEVMADVSAALDFSHRHGIVHRDVKPANVMITKSGAVKVMDFGIARAVHDGQAAVTQTAAVIGTAQYLSPEQARGESVDARSDVYASGCVLFELLTGEPPFTGDSPVAVAYQHVREDPKPPSSLNSKVTPALDAIVLKAMAKNPANRYQSAAEMRADLVRVLSGQRPSAPAVMTAEDRTAVLNQSSPPQRTEVVTGGRHRPQAVRAAETSDESGPLDEDEERRARRKRAIMITLVVLLCVAVLALATWITMTLMGGDEEDPGAQQVKVPSVVGLNSAAARGMIEQAGLEFELQPVPCQPGSTPACDADDIDKVLEISPGANQMVKRLSKVVAKVGTNPEQAAVPNLVGLTAQEAQTRLGTDWKLDPNQQTIEVQDPALVGKVAEQNPQANTQVPKGSQITIKIGRAPEQVQLPDVTGQSVENATETLRGSGFRVQTKDVDSAEEEGQVIAQDPPRGRAEKNTVVTLSVSKGNQFVMPDLTGLTENQARNKLGQLGWTGDLQVTAEEPVNEIGQDKKIRSQQIKAGTATSKTQRINVVVGEFQLGGSTPPSR